MSVAADRDREDDRNEESLLTGINEDGEFQNMLKLSSVFYPEARCLYLVEELSLYLHLNLHHEAALNEPQPTETLEGNNKTEQSSRAKGSKKKNTTEEASKSNKVKQRDGENDDDNDKKTFNKKSVSDYKQKFQTTIGAVKTVLFLATLSLSRLNYLLGHNFTNQDCQVQGQGQQRGGLIQGWELQNILLALLLSMQKLEIASCQLSFPFFHFQHLFPSIFSPLFSNLTCALTLLTRSTKGEHSHTFLSSTYFPTTEEMVRVHTGWVVPALLILTKQSTSVLRTRFATTPLHPDASRIQKEGEIFLEQYCGEGSWGGGPASLNTDTDTEIELELELEPHSTEINATTEEQPQHKEASNGIDIDLLRQDNKKDLQTLPISSTPSRTPPSESLGSGLRCALSILEILQPVFSPSFPSSSSFPPSSFFFSLFHPTQAPYPIHDERDCEAMDTPSFLYVVVPST